MSILVLMPRLSPRNIFWGLAALLLVIAVGLLLTSPSAVSERATAERRAAHPDEDAGRGAGTRASLSVDSHTAEFSNERIRIDVSGILAPIRRVEVAAEVPGQVVSVDVAEHAAVEEGEIIVRLDPALPEAAAMRSRAALLRAQSSDGLAQSELRRQRDLSKRGVTSDADLDRAESEARGTSAQVAEAQAALVDAETRLAKTQIRAPFSGVVSRLDLDPGAYLRTGQPVFEVADLNEIEVEVGVSGRDLLALTADDAVELRVQALPGERFSGRIASLGRTADAVTRKYPVPVVFANDQLRLLPGMIGTLRFELGDARAALVVPRRALRREFDLDYIYVLQSEGDGRAVARRRRVTTQPLAFRPDVVEVTRGVEPGEQIATTGIRELRDGQAVRVRGQGGTPGPL